MTTDRRSRTSADFDFADLVEDVRLWCCFRKAADAIPHMRVLPSLGCVTRRREQVARSAVDADRSREVILAIQRLFRDILGSGATSAPAREVLERFDASELAILRVVCRTGSGSDFKASTPLFESAVGQGIKAKNFRYEKMCKQGAEWPRRLAECILLVDNDSPSPPPTELEEFIGADTLKLLHDYLGAKQFGALHASEISVDTRYRVSMNVLDDRLLCTTTLSAMRVYPEVTEVFWSACSNQDTLTAEFAAQSLGCLSREEVPVRVEESIDEWFDRVSALDVSLVVDGRKAPLLGTSQDVIAEKPDTGFTRYRCDAGPLAEHLTPFVIRARFDLPPGSTHFPIEFHSYWCIGTTEVQFEVDGANVVVENRPHLGPSCKVEPISESAVIVQMTRDPVLHRSAGIDFFWHPK